MQRNTRMQREVDMLRRDPPFGISCWCKGDDVTSLEAQIVGGSSTPYAKGVFKLQIQIPERYPFEPPKVQFLTPIYHPNIDTSGRICLDLLKMPPAGNWKPSINISTVLTSIQLLMAEPNPDDPLMAHISAEFKHNRPQYVEKAKEWTHRHAVSCNISQTSSVDQSSNESDESDASTSDDDDNDDDDDEPASKSANRRTQDTNTNSKLSNDRRGVKRHLKELNGMPVANKKSNTADHD